MKSNKIYAVFGLGRYGVSVAKELADNGAEVLAVDIDEDIVNSVIDELPFCKCADVTDMDVIKKLGISNVDVVIIAMATNLEASVMATMLCKEVGVETVITKSLNHINSKILSKVGADKVVFPEIDSGKRLAKNLLSSDFIDAIELSDDIAIVELDVKNEWDGKTLKELQLRKKYAINIIAIVEEGTYSVEFDPNIVITRNMKLVVIASKEKVIKLKKK